MADDAPGVDLGIAGIEDAVAFARGGNALVYRARQTDLDRVVVVKVLQTALDDAARRRFDRERKAMGRLSDIPGVVPVYQSGFTSLGEPYLIMPFYEAGSLQDELQRAGAFRPEQLVSDLAAMCDAVHAAHASGVLHRDLKPANILRSTRGQPMVADFGIARLLDESMSVSTGITMTPLYTAPETIAGIASSVASDVYGLGAVGYALLAGRPAYSTGEPGDSMLALMRRITDLPLPALPAHVPADVAAVIGKAMSKDPAARFQSAAEMSAALRACRPGLGAATFTSAQGPAASEASRASASVASEASRASASVASEASRASASVPRPLRVTSGAPTSRWPLFGAAAVLVVAAVIGGFFLFGTGDDGGSPDEAASSAPEEISVAVDDAITTIAPQGEPDSGEGEAQNPPDLLATPTPTAATPEPTVSAAAVAAIEAATVRIEGFACGAATSRWGVVVDDGTILSDAVAGRSSWFVDVSGPGQVPVRAFAGRYDPSLGLSALAPVAALSARAVDTGSVARDSLDVETAAASGLPVWAVDGEGDLVRGRLAAGSTRLSGVFERPLGARLGIPVFDEGGSVVGVLAGGVGVNVEIAPAADYGQMAAPASSCDGFPPDFAPPEWKSAESERIQAMLLSQFLADGLASGDWPLVRTLEPGKATYTDQRFDDGWGGLERLQLVPIRVEPVAGAWRLRLGLVGHEWLDGEQITTAFCVSWDADLVAGTVVQTGIDSIALNGPDASALAGFVDPFDLLTVFRDVC